VDSLRYVLQLFTLVQQPGILKTMQFYDSEKDDVIDEQIFFAGDTLRFKNFVFQMTPNSSTDWKIIGSDIEWFVTCESLNYLNNSSSYEEKDCKDEQKISSNYLIALEGGIDKTAELIAQSVADPAKRDTLKISIIARED
jgi:CRISPR/Cas system CMR-associated protein Cmr5 small subunit